MPPKSRLDITLTEVSVRRGRHWALRDVSWTLCGGERWALIGGNGAGKTQLLKVVCGDVWPTPTGREAVRYRVGRRTLHTMEAKARIAYVGAERQDKYQRYGWNPTVADLIATGLQHSDLLQRPATRSEQRKIARLLDQCRIGHLASRPFLGLSYGQKRLALLARALATEPQWLLLDEFYNGLDVRFRGRLDAVLASLRRAGQSWIVAAHRAQDVPPGTTRLLELESGRAAAAAPLTRGALARLDADGGAGAGKRDGAGSEVRAGRRRDRAAPPAGRVLVQLAHADLYVDYRRVLADVDWTLRAGEHWAVVGANGAGKSSFLKLLYGDLSPALGGAIRRPGFPAGTPIAAWKRHVGFVSPELQADYAVNVSVFELVASGRHASIGLVDPPTPLDRRAARRWLKFFELEALALRRPRELSYGQLRRALLARALAAEPRLLLLDEPLTGLDPAQRAAVKRLLEKLMLRKVAIVIAVHHAADLPRGMTHRLHLHKRRAIASSVQSAT